MGQAEDGMATTDATPVILGPSTLVLPPRRSSDAFPASLWDPVARVREIAEPSTVATR